MNRYLSSESGMSVVELLIAVTLSILIGSAAMEFYVTQHKSWLMQNEAADVQQSARAAIDEIASTLRMGGYELPDTHPPFALDTNRVIAYYRENGVIDTMAYFLASVDSAHTHLMRQLNNQQAEVFAPNIESLVVNDLGSNQLEIMLTAKSEKPDEQFLDGDGYRRRSFSTRVFLRNL